MRVQLKKEGGLAYFPGLSHPVTIDSAELPPAETAELERLVREAHFFDLPPAAGAPAPGAADHQQYTVTVEDGPQRHTVRWFDPVSDPRHQALLRFVQERARPAAASGAHLDKPTP